MNSAELETVRVSKCPTTVAAASGESAHRRSDRIRHRIWFTRDSNASRWYTGCSLTRKNLPKLRIFLRVDLWPEATASVRLTTYQSLSLVNRQAVLHARLHIHLLHQYCRKQSIPHQEKVKVREAQCGETRLMNQQKPKNKCDWRQRECTGKPIAWSARKVRRIHGESGGWKCSSSILNTHFPKDKHCETCKRTKIVRAPCRNTGTAVLRAENFGDLITTDHQVLSKAVNLETIIDMLSWYSIWLLDGFNLVRSKPRLLGKPKRAYTSSWSQCGNPKSYTLTIP